MSMNRYAQLVLGAVVQPDDIYDQVKVPATGCKHCSYFTGQQLKFCAECGSSLLPKVKATWKQPVFRVLQRTDRLCQPDHVDAALFNWPMFSLAGVIIVGAKLACVPEDPRKPTIVKLDALEESRAKVQALLREMEISDREICLFPYVFVC